MNRRFDIYWDGDWKLREVAAGSLGYGDAEFEEVIVPLYHKDVLKLLEPDIARKYNELLYAVAKKYPGETRHETALRYIREREQPFEYNGVGGTCQS